MKKYVYTSIQPECGFITKCKRYEIIVDGGSDGWFKIRDDDDDELLCSYVNCPVLDGAGWSVVTYEDTAKIPKTGTAKMSEDTTAVDSYKEVIDYLPTAQHKELLGIALETAKSNPAFFMKALELVRERDGITPSPTIGDLINQKLNAVKQYTIDIGSMGYVYIDATELITLISEMNKNGKKIEAIKRVRELTGLGLREAKDIVDYFDARTGSCAPSNVERELDKMVINGRIKVQ